METGFRIKAPAKTFGEHAVEVLEEMCRELAGVPDPIDELVENGYFERISYKYTAKCTCGGIMLEDGWFNDGYGEVPIYKCIRCMDRGMYHKQSVSVRRVK